MNDSANADTDVQAIYKILELHKHSHPKAKIKSYRQNSGSIRIRVIDPDFAKLDKALRHDQIWELLEQLPEDIQSQITVVLLLAPAELKTSIANLDFDNPVSSRL